jgi:hypothetical protein
MEQSCQASGSERNHSVMDLNITIDVQEHESPRTPFEAAMPAEGVLLMVTDGPRIVMIVDRRPTGSTPLFEVPYIKKYLP